MQQPWYKYLLCFLAGCFFINAFPHLFNGLSGNFFPTPFADPPGKGLSHPTINVLWAFFNVFLSFIFARIQLASATTGGSIPNIT